MSIARQLQDAYKQIDTAATSGIAIAEALAFLGRFYYDIMRNTNPDAFYGLGEEAASMNELHLAVRSLENLVQANRLMLAEYGGRDEFLAWAREIEE